MATATSRPPVRDIRDPVNPPRGFDQSAMLTSYRVWDYETNSLHVISKQPTLRACYYSISCMPIFSKSFCVCECVGLWFRCVSCGGREGAQCTCSGCGVPLSCRVDCCGRQNPPDILVVHSHFMGSTLQRNTPQFGDEDWNWSRIDTWNTVRWSDNIRKHNFTCIPRVLLTVARKYLHYRSSVLASLHLANGLNNVIQSRIYTRNSLL